MAKVFVFGKYQMTWITLATGRICNTLYFVIIPARADDEESTVVQRSNRRTKKEAKKSSGKRKVRKKGNKSSKISRSLAEGERIDICFDFRAGNCTRGSSCKFYHDPKYNFGFNDPEDDRRTLFQSVRALGEVLVGFDYLRQALKSKYLLL